MNNYYKILLVLISFTLFNCSSVNRNKKNTDITDKPAEKTLANTSNQKPLNVLFIAVDDLKPDLGCYGDTYAITPHLDQFAEKAVVFNNNMCQWAVCGPSRASLLTGKRPDYTKVRDLKTRMRDINPDIVSIPQYFKQNGYLTMGVGKIYDPRCVDENLDKPSWSVPFYKEWDIPYNKKYGKPVFGYYQNPKIKNRIKEMLTQANAKGIKNPQLYVRKHYKPPYEISDAPDDAYVDGAIANQGMKLLETAAKQDKPFFVAVGFKRPHLPFVANKKYWDLYDPDKIPLAKYQEMSIGGPKLAYHSSNELRSYKDDTIEYKLDANNLLRLDRKTQKKLIHGYYACTSFVDVQVGKVLNKLKELGLDKNTIVIIWGDHGWHLGDHSLWNKHSNFEQATRAPMLIYTPKNIKPAMINSPTEFVDIFPTLCDLTGLQIPDNLDGKSLKPIIDGTTSKIKNIAVSEISRGKKTGYSFRNDRYRYTVWINKKVSTDPIYETDIFAEELYDYVDDPLEKINFVKNPEYQKILKQMKKEAFSFFKEQYVKNKK